MQNITSYLGEPHVTSDQFRGIIESLVGDGTYITNIDEQLEPELSTNNTLKIRSGVLIHHGHVMRVPPGTYDTVTYINGSQGMKRIDLVVARYEKNSETKKEPTKWVVIQGTPDVSSPVAPDYNEGNMQDGDLIDDCPVFEMHFDGINVTEVKKLVEVTKDIDDLRKNVDELNSTLRVYRKRISLSSVEIPADTVLYFDLLQGNTYDGYTLIGCVIDHPNLGLVASIPQVNPDGRIYTRLWNYTGTKNTYSCDILVYFVKDIVLTEI